MRVNNVYKGTLSLTQPPAMRHSIGGSWWRAKSSRCLTKAASVLPSAMGKVTDLVDMALAVRRSARAARMHLGWAVRQLPAYKMVAKRAEVRQRSYPLITILLNSESDAGRGKEAVIAGPTSRHPSLAWNHSCCSIFHVVSLGNHTSSLTCHSPPISTMNNDALAIALDRLKFYARDAAITLTQARVSRKAGCMLTRSSAFANRKSLPGTLP